MTMASKQKKTKNQDIVCVYSKQRFGGCTYLEGKDGAPIIPHWSTISRGYFRARRAGAPFPDLMRRRPWLAGFMNIIQRAGCQAGKAERPADQDHALNFKFYESTRYMTSKLLAS